MVCLEYYFAQSVEGYLCGLALFSIRASLPALYDHVQAFCSTVPIYHVEGLPLTGVEDNIESRQKEVNKLN